MSVSYSRVVRVLKPSWKFLSRSMIVSNEWHLFFQLIYLVNTLLNVSLDWARALFRFPRSFSSAFLTRTCFLLSAVLSLSTWAFLNDSFLSSFLCVFLPAQLVAGHSPSSLQECLLRLLLRCVLLSLLCLFSLANIYRKASVLRAFFAPLDWSFASFSMCFYWGSRESLSSPYYAVLVIISSLFIYHVTCSHFLT